MSVEVRVLFDSIKIYIDGLLHLYISRQKLLGVQSWKWSGRYYCIEYTMQGGNNILSEYNNEATWKEILKQLDEKGVLISYGIH